MSRKVKVPHDLQIIYDVYELYEAQKYLADVYVETPIQTSTTNKVKGPLTVSFPEGILKRYTKLKTVADWTKFIQEHKNDKGYAPIDSCGSNIVQVKKIWIDPNYKFTHSQTLKLLALIINTLGKVSIEPHEGGYNVHVMGDPPIKSSTLSVSVAKLLYNYFYKMDSTQVKKILKGD